MGLDGPQIASLVTGITGIGAALAALRKLRLESKDSVVTNFQKLITEQRTDLDRQSAQILLLNTTIDTMRKQQDDQIAKIRDDCNKSIEANRAEYERQIGMLRQRVDEQEQLIIRQAMALNKVGIAVSSPKE